MPFMNSSLSSTLSVKAFSKRSNIGFGLIGLSFIAADFGQSVHGISQTVRGIAQIGVGRQGPFSNGPSATPRPLSGAGLSKGKEPQMPNPSPESASEPD